MTILNENIYNQGISDTVPLQSVIGAYEQLYRNAQMDAALDLLFQPLSEEEYGSYSSEVLQWLNNYETMMGLLQPLATMPSLQLISPKHQAILFYYLALAANRLNQKQLATDYATKSLHMANKLNDAELKMKTLYEFASVYLSQRDYQRSIATFQHISALAQQVNAAYEQAWSLDRIATIYCYDLGKVVEGINYYTQALQVALQTGDDALISGYWAELGAAYQQGQQYEQALECYQHELSLAQSAGDILKESSGFENIGSVHQELGQYEQAVTLYQQAFALLEQTDELAGASLVADKLTETYSALGDADKAEYYRNRAAEYDKILFAE